MYRIISIFLMALLLVSCSNPIYIYLYNNTADIIQANNGANTIKIAPRETDYLKVVNNFSLCISSKQFQYSVYGHLPPGEYYGTEHFPLHSIHFQVENNGSLYLVKPDEKLPSKLESQPQGFPVKSNNPHKCNITKA